MTRNLDGAENVHSVGRGTSPPSRVRRQELPRAGFAVVGRVVTTWGRRGEIKVEPMTDFPERFNPGSHVYLRERTVSIEESRWHKGRVIVKLAGVNSLDDAEELRGAWLEVPEDERRPLEEGHYYLYQVLGLEVYSRAGEFLGKVAEVLRTPSNDVYVVQSQGRELLVPAIEDVIQNVDMAQRRMIIDLLPGLGP